MWVSKNPFRLLKAALAQFSTAGSLMSPLVVHPWLISGNSRSSQAPPMLITPPPGCPP